MPFPKVELGVLPNADGSVQFWQNGYVVIAAVNGPVEAQRRDEVPEEVFIEVNVRAPSGPGGPIDRNLESTIEKTLKAIVDLRVYPRQMIQVTLQVLRAPESSYSVGIPTQHRPAVHLLPPLINSAILALLNGNIPLLDTCASCLVFKSTADAYSLANGQGELGAYEIHAFAYSGSEELLLHSAEGHFGGFDWTTTTEISKEACCGDDGLLPWLKAVTKESVTNANAWRQQPV